MQTVYDWGRLAGGYVFNWLRPYGYFRCRCEWPNHSVVHIVKELMVTFMSLRAAQPLRGTYRKRTYGYFHVVASGAKQSRRFDVYTDSGLLRSARNGTVPQSDWSTRNDGNLPKVNRAFPQVMLDP